MHTHAAATPRAEIQSRDPIVRRAIIVVVVIVVVVVVVCFALAIDRGANGSGRAAWQLNS